MLVEWYMGKVWRVLHLPDMADCSGPDGANLLGLWQAISDGMTVLACIPQP